MAAYGSDLRMVLLGKTGSGKSAAGNTILGRKDFSVSMFSKSVTRKCEKHESTEFGRKISVVDTEITVDKLKAEIERCVELSVPGPHVFLLVIRLGVRFTAEERNTVEWIQENFGKEASKHTIVLFTHADALKTVQIEQYIEDDKHLKQLVAECGGRYHQFNNEDMENRSQVLKLLKKINVLSSTYYTNEMYQAVQKRLEEEKEKKRKEEAEKRKQWEEKIRADERKKFEEVNQKLKDKYEKLKEEIKRKKEEEKRKQWEERIRAQERKKFEEKNQKLIQKDKREKGQQIAFGAGLAVGGVASVVAVAAEIGLVAVVAPVALTVLPLIGAVIGWALYKKSKNKDGYEHLSNSQSDIS